MTSLESGALPQKEPTTYWHDYAAELRARGGFTDDEITRLATACGMCGNPLGKHRTPTFQGHLHPCPPRSVCLSPSHDDERTNG